MSFADNSQLETLAAYMASQIHLPAVGTAAGKDYTTSVQQDSEDLVTSGGAYTADMHYTSVSIATSGWTSSTYTSNTGAYYRYKKDITVSGMTANSYVYGMPSSGTMKGAYAIESASNTVTVRVYTKPSSTITMIIFYKI